MVYAELAHAENETGVSTGTGWVVAPHFVVTNHHVVGEANSVMLIRTDNRQIKADVVMRDPINDVVILKPQNIKFLPPGLPMAVSSANVGTNVFTIGYPLLAIMGREPKLTTGYVNARTGIANDPRTYQISVPIQPGNSGGPVFNMNGEVIGIATSSLSAAEVFEWAGNLPQNVNYAVKTNYVRALLDAAPVHSKDIINTLTAEPANLEQLVQRVKDSIVIVIAGKEEKPVQVKITEPKTPEPIKSSPAHQKQAYALYVYMKPSNYDQRNNNTRAGFDDTTSNFSHIVSDLVKHFIKNVSNEKLSLADVSVGDTAFDIIYDAYNEDDRPNICKNKKVDFLFSAKNDLYGMGTMDVTFYIFDCKSNTDFYYTNSLDHNQHDSFMYETHLKKILRNMMVDKPGSIKLQID